MHVFLWAEDSKAELCAELRELFYGNALAAFNSSWLECEFATTLGQHLPYFVFARQWLPDARPVRADSIRMWANAVIEAIAGVLPDDRPWSLAIAPHYAATSRPRMGARAWDTLRPRIAAHRESKVEAESTNAGRGAALTAGAHRCGLIREALIDLLQKKRRHLLRQLRPEPTPFTAEDSFVQLLLTAPDAGFISLATAPLPFEQRHLLSPFPKGEVPAASDPTAPSRAFAKLVEAEQRFGRAIQAGEICVDLGAAPGSWTYVAVNRGAHVIAVDRSPLRADLMEHPLVDFQSCDAFRFQVQRPVDWLLCDVIAAPERNAELLLEWLRRGWCRHFIVTLKLGSWSGANRGQQRPQVRPVGPDVFTRLKRELPPLTRELFLTRLCTNKNEVCAFGSATANRPV